MFVEEIVTTEEPTWNDMFVVECPSFRACTAKEAAISQAYVLHKLFAAEKKNGSVWPLDG